MGKCKHEKHTINEVPVNTLLDGHFPPITAHGLHGRGLNITQIITDYTDEEWGNTGGALWYTDYTDYHRLNRLYFRVNPYNLCY